MCGAAGISNPLQVVIDLDHQRLAVQNDHCYTPFTSPSQRHSESRRSSLVANTKKPDVVKVKAKQIPSKAQPKNVSDEEEEVSDEEMDESDSDNTYNSPSENENDRDSDLDFNLNDRQSRTRKANRSKNSRNKRLKGAAKVSKKRVSVGDEEKSDEATTSSGKKKFSKRRSLSSNKTPTTSNVKTPATTPKVSTLVKVSTKTDGDVEPNKDTPMSISPAVLSGPPVPALAPITTTKTTIPQKKDKKQPAHVDAYFNNMSSLFSTPDIIKNVGNDSRSSPNTTSTSTSLTPPNKAFFMPLNPSSIKSPQQLTAQISVQTHTATPDLEFEQDKQLDLIDSFVRDIVQEELKQQTPPHIPNLVRMLENSETGILGDSTQSTANTSFGNTSTIRENLLDDSDILGLGQAEDCLPDDLLQHVAKLVEDKKIQEVIDKQVLQENATNSTIPPIPPMVSTPIPLNVSKPDSTIKGPKQTEVTKSAKSKSTTATPLQAKEPIKIVRSDGRVILLPPLEAPTTRAKRRALTQSFDSNAKNEPTTSTPKTKPVSKVVEEVKEKEKSRRSSTTKKLVEQPKSKPIVTETPSTVPSIADDDYDDMDSDGSNNAEDDPDRLWCICRQPHNNRFMICCDKCEDWFHGKCVNVTKSMGTEMEEQGIEWVCPNCVKKQPGKKPPERKSSTSKGVNTSLLSCIVCKKPARPNSIYCSDDCIRRHAQVTASNVTSSQSDSSVGSKKSTLAKLNAKPEYTITKNNRVIVFEPKTGRVLTGNTAPTPDTLQQWLAENPTFEVVKPGSKQEQLIKEKQEQINRQNKQIAQSEKPKPSNQQQPQQQKIQTTLKIGPSKNVMIVNPTKKPVPVIPTPTAMPAKVTTKIQKISSQTPPKLTTPVKQSPVMTKTVTKPTTPKTPTSRPSNPNKRKSDPKTEFKSPEGKSETSSETIRVTVRRLLKEAISQRMSEITESKHPKLTADEIDSFASDTEREIYYLFSKDIGTKYRAKYRSLVFNIKDRKNDSLFRKICEKTIQPNQFVRMTAEELASQQLAQWRENENKHQLEMIKKSELDLLACAKSYVLKTHKGEEVIESKISDRVTLDPSVSVEDVVSVLNNSTVSSTSETVDLSPPAKDQRIDTRFDKYLSVDSSVISGSGKLGTSTSKKKDGHRSRSHDRSQDKNDKKSSSSKHKRKRSREKRSRSRDKRSGDKDKNIDERIRDRDKDRDSKKKDDKRDREKLKAMDSKEDSKKSSIKVKEPPKPVKKEGNFNLIDKILEAQSTIDRVLRAEDTKKIEVKSTNKSATPFSDKPASSSECDQEPSSTVTIPTPPEYLFDKQLDEVEPALWTGVITMVDTATFQISVYGVSGDCDSIKNELPPELDIVGRIIPDTVWEYIEKIKKNKEILIVRLSPATEDDGDAYCVLYKYLYTKKRLGVIKTASRSIKDFYIFPLAAHKSLPSVLQSIHDNDFESGRPDLLLGIVVKTTVAITKRSSTAAIPPIPSKVKNQVAELGRSSALIRGRSTDSKLNEEKCPEDTPAQTLTHNNAPCWTWVYTDHEQKKDFVCVAIPALCGKNANFSISEDGEQITIKYDWPELMMKPSELFSQSRKNGRKIAMDHPKVHSFLSHLHNSGVTENSTLRGDLTIQLPRKVQRENQTWSMEKISRLAESSIVKPRIPTTASEERYTSPSSPKTLPKSQILDIPTAMEDGDEPYSPGGSDDEIPFQNTKTIPTSSIQTSCLYAQMEQDEIQRKMDELNRQIEAQKMEIAGMLHSDVVVDEPYSPTSSMSTTSKPAIPALANISIPSNLQEILNSINKVTSLPTAGTSLSTTSTASTLLIDEEYTPTTMDMGYNSSAGYIPMKTTNRKSFQSASTDMMQSTSKEPSKLAQLTEEELLSMVPDDIELAPVAPVAPFRKQSNDPTTRMPNYNIFEPPPPGEEEYIP
ncbi:Death-inducer obliterator 1 [Pseudolycoriella hygida]|uniref:Death-inducer obliterator 1 n=1 Tax=Pseudolycoriella hygida TaxID=35572 RepID=A0A9Q0S3C9_9DIPT|nr:Death-inducer obliterator 1 [Pseudolycoriella hygida]